MYIRQHSFGMQPDILGFITKITALWAARGSRDSFAFSAAQKIIVSPPSSRRRPSCHRQLGFYFRIPLQSQNNPHPKGWGLFCV
jgi:hypothetical protein